MSIILYNTTVGNTYKCFGVNVCVNSIFEMPFATEKSLVAAHKIRPEYRISEISLHKLHPKFSGNSKLRRLSSGIPLIKEACNYSAYQNQLIDIDFDETDMSDY